MTTPAEHFHHAGSPTDCRTVKCNLERRGRLCGAQHPERGQRFSATDCTMLVGHAGDHASYGRGMRTETWS